MNVLKINTILVTDCRRGATAWPAVGESIIAGSASATSSPDHIVFARTLAPEGIAFQFRGTHEVTETTKCPTVVFCCYREHGIAAKSCG